MKTKINSISGFKTEEESIYYMNELRKITLNDSAFDSEPNDTGKQIVTIYPHLLNKNDIDDVIGYVNSDKSLQLNFK